MESPCKQVSLKVGLLHVSRPRAEKRDLSHIRDITPLDKKKEQIYILTKENDKNNSNAQSLE